MYMYSASMLSLNMHSELFPFMGDNYPVMLLAEVSLKSMRLSVIWVALVVGKSSY